MLPGSRFATLFLALRARSFHSERKLLMPMLQHLVVKLILLTLSAMMLLSMCSLTLGMFLLAPLLRRLVAKTLAKTTTLVSNLLMLMAPEGLAWA